MAHSFVSYKRSGNDFLYGEDHAYRNSKIINRATGEIYESAKAASESLGISSVIIHRYCKKISKSAFDLDYYPEVYKTWLQRMKESKAISCYK